MAELALRKLAVIPKATRPKTETPTQWPGFVCVAPLQAGHAAMKTGVYPRGKLLCSLGQLLQRAIDPGHSSVNRLASLGFAHLVLSAGNPLSEAAIFCFQADLQKQKSPALWLGFMKRKYHSFSLLRFGVLPEGSGFSFSG
ncbi:hypothetical protein [Pseudomonas sp. VLB120]|uniref:hypothetical protein n=1 Tax=Pseudomonas sp. VLB120 TaxID=69328 RepID=UPI00130E647F